MKSLVFSLVLSALCVLSLQSAHALTCAKAPNGRLVPVDQEAKQIVEAFKPAKYCDSNSVKDAIEMLNKKITIVTMSAQEQKTFSDAAESARKLRIQKKLQKAGLSN